MNPLEWLKHYPLEALPYEIGFILLAISMVWYSIVLKKMVAIIHERLIWILPFAGALFIFVSVGMHSFAYLVWMPEMDRMTTVADISRMSAFMMKWRAWSLAGIMLGGLSSLIGGAVYYRWTTR